MKGDSMIHKKSWFEQVFEGCKRINFSAVIQVVLAMAVFAAAQTFSLQTVINDVNSKTSDIYDLAIAISSTILGIVAAVVFVKTLISGGQDKTGGYVAVGGMLIGIIILSQFDKILGIFGVTFSSN